MKLILLTLLAAVGYTYAANPLCPTVDGLFLIDSSQSITKDQFENIKSYAQNFTSQFEIGPNIGQAQFGGIIFNEDVKYQWALNKFGNKDALMMGIKNTPYITGTTNTGKAFITAKSVMIGAGARSAACRAIILFTDGRYDHGDNPIPLAEALRNEMHATVLSVAVEGINGFLSPYDYDLLVKLSGSKDLVFVMKTKPKEASTQMLRMKAALMKIQ